MSKFVAIAARLVRAVQRISERKMHFLGISLFIFIGSVVTLAQFDLLPNTEPTLTASADAIATTTVPHATVSSSTPMVTELPVKITIGKINLTATVANPTMTNIEALDKELLKGAVRYPTSAKLGENGNVVLFGHSSYLPIVGNQAYKTFDGIQKLVAGDVVTVYSSGTAYTYKVRSMTKASANDGAIPLAVTGRVLTLATCNSFGAKTDRFVVVADFVESHSISI